MPAKKEDARRRPLHRESIYAAAVRENAVLRSTEVSALLTSSAGQTSLAPTANAAIHMSSSGTR